MVIKIVIVIDEKGEIWYYTTEDVAEDVMFIQPKIKKEEGETEKDDERVH